MEREKEREKEGRERKRASKNGDECLWTFAVDLMKINEKKIGGLIYRLTRKKKKEGS